MNSQPKRIVVGLGEALFDCFPDHQSLGGAPLNATLVAHALGAPFGLVGQMISRVGNDDLGKQVIETAQQRGLDVATIQVDDSAPTGRVNVQMVDGQPEYEIIENVAWDRIAWEPSLSELARQAAGITFGSLAQRSQLSRETIWQFLKQATNAVRLFDVNLRQNFYNAEVLGESCHLANAVKLNSSELSVITTLLELKEADPIKDLQESFGIKHVILTHGEKGTELINDSGTFRAEVPTFEKQSGSDPVGAGDACGATCLIGLILGWPENKIVENANRVGAFVASRAGATPEINPNEILSL